MTRRKLHDELRLSMGRLTTSESVRYRIPIGSKTSEGPILVVLESPSQAILFYAHFTAALFGISSCRDSDR
jgi:hypothetical protein